MFDPLKPGYLYVASWQNRERPYSPARRWIAGVLGALALLSALVAFALVFATLVGVVVIVGAAVTVAMLLQRVLGRGRSQLPTPGSRDVSEQRWETIEVVHAPPATRS